MGIRLCARHPRGCWRFSPGAERTLLWARQPAVRSRSRVGAGLVLSRGLVPLNGRAIDRPVVECIAGGVQTSVPMGIWFGSASGSSTSSASGGIGARGEVTSSSVPRTPGLVTVGRRDLRVELHWKAAPRVHTRLTLESRAQVRDEQGP